MPRGKTGDKAIEAMDPKRRRELYERHSSTLMGATMREREMVGKIEAFAKGDKELAEIRSHIATLIGLQAVIDAAEMAVKRYDPNGESGGKN